jgi:urease accessory protein
MVITPQIMATIMTDADWLLPLSAWLSPAYPVGGFSYSHGLEEAVAAGRVADWQQLADYVATALEAGGGWTDLVLLAQAWRAADDDNALDAITELAAAMRGTAETAMESANQGAAFVLATGAAWPGMTAGSPMPSPSASPQRESGYRSMPSCSAMARPLPPT